MKQTLLIISLAFCMAGFGQITPSNVTALTNGLTKSGNTGRLGGALTANTAVTFNPNSKYMLLGDAANSRMFAYGNLTSFGGDTNQLLFYGLNTFNSVANTHTFYSYDALTVSAGDDSLIGAMVVTPEAATPAVGLSIRKPQDYEAGFYAIHDGSHKFANIYYGVLDSSNNITDQSRWEANADEIHGRKYITVGGNYNGVHCNTTYSQLEFDKAAEDGQATGTLAVLNGNGFGYYVGGTEFIRFDNTGNVGIGISTPTGLLDAVSGNGRLLFDPANEVTNMYFNGGDDQIYLDGANHQLRFYVNDQSSFLETANSFAFYNGSFTIGNLAGSGSGVVGVDNDGLLSFNSNVASREAQSNTAAPSSPQTVATTKNITWKSFSGIGGALTINMSGGSVGDELFLALGNDATLGRTITWGTNILANVGTLLLTVSKKTICHFVYDGTNWCLQSTSLAL